MKLSETIQEVKWSLPSKRMLDVVNIGAVEIEGKLLLLKSRASLQEVNELRENGEFIHYNGNHGYDYAYDELLKKNVIFDESILGRRGLEAIKRIKQGFVHMDDLEIL